ncbi:hypothetical protein ASPVEDRAFT_89593 [Aspergillus versicolor CBS 583.65]|uniref:Uncharacterized protein n=1 Tax=Aspergillus versicolor CBS 583.65 TaxID=1036611 RepID=A0A1L9Q3W3_ASPVE|nr:uncharacterized protein ASPVEDRAFT_89593 [Aspergillus versicolor CBS 583.65]OJJ08368.1 hypothetical protein ASPVEDRAFT_89593 [Aspergillus versicolor CBS 583.65]
MRSLTLETSRIIADASAINVECTATIAREIDPETQQKYFDHLINFVTGVILIAATAASWTNAPRPFRMLPKYHSHPRLDSA